MTDQKAAGEVTREHREAAAKAHYGAIWKHLSVIHWRDSGVQNGGISDEMVRIAQAIASACHQRDQRIAELEAEVARLKAKLHQHEGKYDSSGLLKG